MTHRDPVVLLMPSLGATDPGPDVDYERREPVRALGKRTPSDRSDQAVAKTFQVTTVDHTQIVVDGKGKLEADFL